MTIFYLISDRNTFGGTGIDRATKSILLALKSVVKVPTRIRVVVPDDLGNLCLVDDINKGTLKKAKHPVHPGPGDILLSVDLVYHLSDYTKSTLRKLRGSGVKIVFVLHDLIPIRRPEWFMAAGDVVERKKYLETFTSWVEFVFAEADALLCVSRYVLDDARSFVGERYNGDGPRLYWFHHGVDPNIWGQRRSKSNDVGRGPTEFRLLMVGTLEPRKSQDLALDAFEMLWRDNYNFTLVIAGRVGKPWMSKYQTNLVNRCQEHSQYGRRLVFVEGASDATILDLYKGSDALLMLSEDEGFGIPLIEAAYCGLPIIVRDIPVFREVCATSAYYFQGGDAHQLKKTLVAWSELFRIDAHPKSDAMPVNTWHESALQIINALAKEGATVRAK